VRVARRGSGCRDLASAAAGPQLVNGHPVACQPEHPLHRQPADGLKARTQRHHHAVEGRHRKQLLRRRELAAGLAAGLRDRHRLRQLPSVPARTVAQHGVGASLQEVRHDFRVAVERSPMQRCEAEDRVGLVHLQRHGWRKGFAGRSIAASGCWIQRGLHGCEVIFRRRPPQLNRTVGLPPTGHGVAPHVLGRASAGRAATARAGVPARSFLCVCM
jgi:hypothetical protein